MSRARTLMAAVLALSCCLGVASAAVGTAENPLPVFNFGKSDFKETVANYRKDKSWGTQRTAIDSLKESIATPRGVWQLGKEWSVDETVGKDDTFSLKVTHKRHLSTDASVLLPPFDQYDEFIFPRYDLSLDLKTENASGTLFIEIRTEEPDGKQSVHKVAVKGTRDWQHLAYVTETPCRMWKFRLRLRFAGRGTLWVDNVYLRAVNLGPRDAKIGLEKVVEINQGWKFKTDPDEVGSKNGYHKPGLDVSKWEDISVLQSWDSQGYKKYNGYAWYRNNNVMVPEWVKGDRLSLYFGGVDELGAVWVNGKFVGSHIFWEFPFTLDVTDAVKPGERNEIAVKVFDSMYGGGIYGGVILMRTPKPGEEKTHDIADTKRLFLDESLIASRKDVEFTMNPPRKAGPVIGADKPWEAQWVGFFTSVLDFGESTYRMYYTAQAPGEAPRFALAESKDGITWTKPELRQVDFQGSQKNNLLANVTGIAGAAFINPTAPKEDRYQIVCASNCAPPNVSKGHTRGSILVFGSPDGLTWRGIGSRTGHCQSDSQAQMFFDEERKNYLAFLPAFESYPGGPRVIIRGEFTWARSFNWPMKQVSGFFTSREERKQPFLHCPMKLEFPVCFRADEKDLPGAQFYTSCVVKYPWAAGAYLAFPSLMQKTSGPDELDEDGTLEIQLAASSDSVSWTRFRAPYVTMGKEGEPDSAVQIMAVGMVRSGDEIYQYYAGGRHTLKTRPYGAVPLQGTWKKEPGEPGIFRLVQRLDGFVSLDAGDKEGTVQTKLLRFDGKQLTLNLDSKGQVRVAILGRDGKAVEGFDLPDCDPITGDSTAKAVTWKGKSDVSALGGTPVRLCFKLRNAKLYAFQFKK